MKGPICRQDIKSGRLCLICAAKLKAGQISQADLDVLKAIETLDNKKFLIATELVRVFDLGKMALIFVKGNAGMLIGRGGKNIKVLEKALGKKVRVAEISKEPRETIQQVIGRARINSMNKIFKPESEELKVMIDSRDRRMIGDKEPLEAMLKTVLKQPVEIAFS